MQPRPTQHKTLDKSAYWARFNGIGEAGPQIGSCEHIRVTWQAASWHHAWNWTGLCPKALESCLWFLLIKCADEIPHHRARQNLSFLCQLLGIPVKPFPNHLFMHEGELECTHISGRCAKWERRYVGLIAPRLRGRRTSQIRMLYLLPVVKFKPVVRIRSGKARLFWKLLVCNL